MAQGAEWDPPSFLEETRAQLPEGKMLRARLLMTSYRGSRGDNVPVGPGPGIATAVLLGRVYRLFQARSGGLLTLANLEAGK